MSFQNRDELAGAKADVIARQSYGKLVAFLAARTHNVTEAEDALSEAFASALVDWPRNGCPNNPEAWLLTVARRKMIDGARRRQRGEAASAQLQLLQEGLDVVDTEIPDRRLALMFVCAHPSIEVNIRAPLILQTLLGLDAKAIGSAFLTSPTAIGKRLVRAKQKIREAGIPFRVPEREELPDRIDAVLDAIYAAFSEGWSDPGGADASRRDLTEEALYLGGLVAELMAEEPEALGLFSLMLYAEARRLARRNAEGEYVPLAEQNPELWDSQMISMAETLLLRAGAMGAVGRYQTEAALQSAHIYRCRTGCANWQEIVQLYDLLISLVPSPVVAVNRALAVSELLDASAGLEALRPFSDDSRLTEYQPYWAARAELLAKSGFVDEANHAYDVAIGLERDPAVRSFLEKRKSRLKKAPRSWEYR